MLTLKYGSYSHDPGECEIVISRQAKVSSQGTIATSTERWTISGKLQADTLALLSTAINSLQSAYAVQGQDAYLLTTPHQLISANTIGGVRVVSPPAFPTGTGAELTTYRSYRIELEAEVIVGGAEAQILEWEETLNFSGGGPKFGFLATQNGPPVKQLLQAQTAYQVTQSGSATGLSGYPVPPGPYWPYAWHQDQGGVSTVAPTLYGTGNGMSTINWKVNWTYIFEDSSPMNGFPQPRRA